MQHPISITAIASISPLGSLPDEIWKNYTNINHFFTKKEGNLIAKISTETKKGIDALKQSNSKYKTLDDSVLYAIYASRQAITNANWKASDNFGINIGSSRGATTLFENYHSEFIKNQKTNTLTSPTTTLGNISSWVAHDLQTQGPEISHSITCSTALHALLNGIAWINSGMCDKFLVGGSEAPLTAFTIAQMQALKIYAKTDDSLFPNQSLDLSKKDNTMILGEGAAMACLESGNTNNALAKIIGIGYATELLEHNASLSTNALCFQRSMKMALGTVKPEDVDVIVTHTPGTIKGDQAEINAIESIFCNKIPSLTTNKWKIGHSLGASGLLNIEMAIMMLQHETFISIPYLKSQTPKRIKNILVNAVGFGGNAVSILLSK
ncbi:beta-ketoacyl synthase N-terminal-like domain-containing protein [Psychroserpens luteolus]|uniref:beta-ketoacyl synthase N-terminal-like domain-containing protein n=1 Tax=Psychroserpens luteolus TaxID=2855840 RepID=UPI001E473BB3|nr:beta-ketoacyl synthase N-terminal-like domain-containing protein [Psychroserpens luteolus]MCD2258014.1 beta-ketoacyl synthase [Psychroserpens luteolus]